MADEDVVEYMEDDLLDGGRRVDCGGNGLKRHQTL
jgi:hypothetical protein